MEPAHRNAKVRIAGFGGGEINGALSLRESYGDFVYSHETPNAPESKTQSGRDRVANHPPSLWCFVCQYL